MASTARVRESNVTIAREFEDKILRDQEVALKLEGEAKLILEELKAASPSDENPAVHAICVHTRQGKEPYATGRYRDAWKLRQNRSPQGRFAKGWTAYNDNWKAHFIEYGTLIDAPGTHSPWGRFTPTPKFAVAATVAAMHKGTAP